jgi:hypothetical protein
LSSMNLVLFIITVGVSVTVVRFGALAKFQ